MLQCDSFFLDHFPLDKRSSVAERFFKAARLGAFTPEGVIDQVKAGISHGLFFQSDPELLETLTPLLNSDEAKRYAQEVIDREALSPEERRKIKADRSEHYRREYLKAQPPTERQIRFLKSLGCETLPANRLHASELIARRGI